MKRSDILIGICTVFSLFLLVLLLQRIDLGSFVLAVSNLDVISLLFAVGLTFVSYWLRAVRWRYLLLSGGAVALSSLYPAVIIGYMANNLFPAKAGELVRAWVLAEREQRPFGAVMASLVVDRLWDGLCMLLMLVLVLFWLPLPPGVQQMSGVMRAGGVTTLLVYLAVLCILFLLKVYPQKAHILLHGLLRPLPERISNRIFYLFQAFVDGLQIFQKSGQLIAVATCSILIWVTATIPIYLVLHGFGLQLPPLAALLIMVLLLFAVMIPSAPGYIGTYHLACYTGLTAYGVSDSIAVSVSLVIHGVGFFPVTLAGFYHAWSLGLSLRRMHQRSTGLKGMP